MAKIVYTYRCVRCDERKYVGPVKLPVEQQVCPQCKSYLDAGEQKNKNPGLWMWLHDQVFKRFK